ncbi:MAG TPA: YkgJ family cysteine cluster protein, partial [Blastocatellia bacterium]|nr:YkgJ family cysteine cluster protein [Blastocatellia bacterium]
MPRKRLTAKRKSELCLVCGKCCMAMTFYGGEVDDDARDEIKWMELHGLRIDYAEKRVSPTVTTLEYYFTIPKRCDVLQENDGKFTCGVYETRPQMCRDYDGRMEGPFGVAECLWRYESEGRPLPQEALIQLKGRPTG